MAVISAVGMTSAGVVGPVLGGVYDRWGAAMVFRAASVLPILPLAIFAGFALTARRRRAG
jgi:cyanate permease